MNNKVYLITYVDRISGHERAGNLQTLARVLAGPLANIFGGIHLLPFYDSIHAADAGFDPKDHLNVDPTLGVWSDIANISQAYPIMADVIVNHMSAQSAQFQDYIEQAEKSPYAGLFLTQKKIFPSGVTQAQLDRIYRPRPTPAFTCYTCKDGSQHLMWTTFTDQQIDIDVQDSSGAAYLTSILKALSANGVTTIRLDAVGYAIKKADTSSFMTPETFDFIAKLSQESKAMGMEILVEVHSHYATQIEIASKVDRVYDFALPPLLLHAFHFGTSKPLQNWINIRPNNAVTVLDTHDGIGIIDIGSDKYDRAGKPGLVPDSELDALVEAIHEASHGQSRQATGVAASNIDLYQVNCTYYDALGRSDTKYLLARLVQFFLPGVPQVYYVGLFAGQNDMALLNRTGVGRDINRSYFSEQELGLAMQRPVVKQLVALIKLRNEHAAFSGQFTANAEAEHMLHMKWKAGAAFAILDVDFKRATGNLHYSDGDLIVSKNFK
jgi:sucrose phosphorylase